MSACTGRYEVPYNVNHPREPLDVTKHESFEDHVPHPPGLALGVQRQFFESGERTGLYCHDDFYELYVIRAGRGVSVINEHSYNLVRGDVYIVSPGGAHGLCDYKGIESDVFYFQTSLFTRAELAALRQMRGFWKLLLHDGDSRHDRKNDRRLHLSPERHESIERIVELIRTDICEVPPLGPLLARQHFFHLLTQLARWHDVQPETKSDGPAVPLATEPARDNAARLADVVRYCEENFHQPITVPQLAARMFVSPDHFARLFSASLGVPPGAYLRNLRMARAQLLLRTTALSVGEIAKEVGLSDPDQLSHSFRATLGTTPTKYRATFRK